MLDRFSVVKTLRLNRLLIKTVTAIIESMMSKAPVIVDANITILTTIEEFLNWSPYKRKAHIVRFSINCMKNIQNEYNHNLFRKVL